MVRHCARKPTTANTITTRLQIHEALIAATAKPYCRVTVWICPNKSKKPVTIVAAPPIAVKTMMRSLGRLRARTTIVKMTASAAPTITDKKPGLFNPMAPMRPLPIAYPTDAPRRTMAT